MASILVIEDMPDIRDIITRQLHYAGHQVISAANGFDGIACARAYLPDLVLMDLVMPVLNGWEAIAQLKADTCCSALPIVAITARAETEIKEKARAVGFDALISKPFTMHELLAVVDALTAIAEEATG